MALVDFEKQVKKDMYLAKDCKITGNLKSSGNITIDGELEGTIETNGDFVLGKQGKAYAEIRAENVCVQGEIRGNLFVTNLLQITSTGIVYGDINTKLLKIEQGGRFVGKSMDTEHTETKAVILPIKESKKEATNEIPTVNQTIDESTAGIVAQTSNVTKNTEFAFKPIVYNRLPK